MREVDNAVLGANQIVYPIAGYAILLMKRSESSQAPVRATASDTHTDPAHALQMLGISTMP